MLASWVEQEDETWTRMRGVVWRRMRRKGRKEGVGESNNMMAAGLRVFFVSVGRDEEEEGREAELA